MDVCSFTISRSDLFVTFQHCLICFSYTFFLINAIDKLCHREARAQNITVPIGLLLIHFVFLDFNILSIVRCFAESAAGKFLLVLFALFACLHDFKAIFLVLFVIW